MLLASYVSFFVTPTFYHCIICCFIKLFIHLLNTNSLLLQSLSITAALLPSLQAQYKMDQVNSTGFTGSKAKFTIDLPHHSLSFTTKLPQVC